MNMLEANVERPTSNVERRMQKRLRLLLLLMLSIDKP
jgi:hypothetical protein